MSVCWSGPEKGNKYPFPTTTNRKSCFQRATDVMLYMFLCNLLFGNAWCNVQRLVPINFIMEKNTFQCCRTISGFSYSAAVLNEMHLDVTKHHNLPNMQGRGRLWLFQILFHVLFKESFCRNKAKGRGHMNNGCKAMKSRVGGERDTLSNRGTPACRSYSRSLPVTSQTRLHRVCTKSSVYCPIGQVVPDVTERGGGHWAEERQSIRAAQATHTEGLRRYSLCHTA